MSYVEHTAELKPGFKPKRMREYKVPECFKAEVEKQLKEMLASGIITESNTPMASPLVVVQKRGPAGEFRGLRLAVDYRCVNSYTVSDAFPVPDIEDVIQRVGSKRYLSTFDCKSSYWQTCIAESCKFLTGFCCLGRLFSLNEHRLA